MIQQLLPNNLDHLKRGLGGNTINKHITVDTDKVLAIHDTILILSNTHKSLATEISPCNPAAKACCYKLARKGAELTCPAVSMISVENS